MKIALFLALCGVAAATGLAHADSEIVRGIAKDGAARGLLFPASLVLVGGKMFVANVALPLTAAVGDEPEEDVATYTISEIDLGDDDRHDDD